VATQANKRLPRTRHELTLRGKPLKRSVGSLSVAFGVA
jgi:hypothetical protein